MFVWFHLRLARLHGFVAAVAILTLPTLGAPRRALSQGRWRDAMFEDPFGRSPGRNKFAEPSSDRGMRLTSLEQMERYGRLK